MQFAHASVTGRSCSAKDCWQLHSTQRTRRCYAGLDHGTGWYGELRLQCLPGADQFDQDVQLLGSHSRSEAGHYDMLLTCVNHTLIHTLYAAH